MNQRIHEALLTRLGVASCPYGRNCLLAVAKSNGRWFITVSHAGYNSPANNRRGYESAARAGAALNRYASVTAKPSPLIVDLDVFRRETDADLKGAASIICGAASGNINAAWATLDAWFSLSASRCQRDILITRFEELVKVYAA